MQDEMIITEEVPMKKILLVEDNPSLLKALQMRFKLERNYEILSGTNGQEGLEIAITKKPDIIITDIMMPEMDGMDMVRKIRTSGTDWAAKVPVIFLTNKIRKNEAYMVNAADYIVKSDIDLKDIIERIKQKIG